MKIKTRSKICLTTLIVASLLVVSMAALVNALPSTANVEPTAKVLAVSGASTSVLVKTNAVSVVAPVPSIVPAEVQKLKEQLPTTFEDADARVLPIRARFLIYTNDLRHIMWGQFGGQYFTGIDNLGKRAWGIYGQGYFAGFYGGQFFWGKYYNGYWSAVNLFGLNYAYGRYVAYPMLPITATASAASP